MCAAAGPACCGTHFRRVSRRVRLAIQPSSHGTVATRPSLSFAGSRTTGFRTANTSIQSSDLRRAAGCRRRSQQTGKSDPYVAASCYYCHRRRCLTLNLNQGLIMNSHEIAVNRAGFHAAMEALMMDDPHPSDYFEDPSDYFRDCPSRWLRRALYAYEWAKRTYLTQNLDSTLHQELPRPGEAREAVLLHEAGEQEGRTRR